MTRKDYELIAKAIADLRNATGAVMGEEFQHGAKQAAQYIASALASDNPRFDRERFLKACGVQ